ncbi:MAG TPA: Flp pilus assembly protein CpaB [Caulobacteraceae bacterium]|nr:Flp pilus assembly protein CpaB [Caulobacteraceae bacterium]
MRTGTVVSLGASAVLGLGALLVARLWLPQQSHAPLLKAVPEVAAGTVPVVVASGALPYGTKLDASKLAIVRMPANAVPQGAFSTPAQILSQQGGAPVTLTAFASHEPLLPAKLSGPGARAIVSAAITEGYRAYTISVTETAGVGGHVLPGDRVDVIVTRQPPTPKAVKDLCDDCKMERADVVLQNVKVIGMDLNVDPTTTQSVISHTATLEVSVLDAQKLAVATQVGTMSLALRRGGQADVTPVRTVEIGDLKSTAPRAPGPVFPDDMQLRALGAKPHAAAPAGPGAKVTIHSGHTIVVVHGDASTTVDVPAYRGGA